MQTTTFRAYELAVQFYRESRSCRLPSHLRNQFDRASSSIVLNLGEGWGRASRKDRHRFFFYALGSVRECQAILRLEQESFTLPQHSLLDRVAATIYRLMQSSGP